MTITKVQLFSGSSTTVLQRQLNEFVKGKRDVLEARLHNAADGLLVLIVLYVELPPELISTNPAGEPA